MSNLCMTPTFAMSFRPPSISLTQCIVNYLSKLNLVRHQSPLPPPLSWSSSMTSITLISPLCCLSTLVSYSIPVSTFWQPNYPSIVISGHNMTCRRTRYIFLCNGNQTASACLPILDFFFFCDIHIVLHYSLQSPSRKPKLTFWSLSNRLILG